MLTEMEQLSSCFSTVSFCLMNQEWKLLNLLIITKMNYELALMWPTYLVGGAGGGNLFFSNSILHTLTTASILVHITLQNRYFLNIPLNMVLVLKEHAWYQEV